MEKARENHVFLDWSLSPGDGDNEAGEDAREGQTR